MRYFFILASLETDIFTIFFINLDKKHEMGNNSVKII